MNWRHGLFRVWIVTSILWVAGMGWYQYNAWSPFNQFDNPADCKYCNPQVAIHELKGPWTEYQQQFCAPYKGVEDCTVDMQIKHHEDVTELRERIVLVLLPPFLILLLSYIVLWIQRGFKAEKS